MAAVEVEQEEAATVAVAQEEEVGVELFGNGLAYFCLCVFAAVPAAQR